MSQPQAKYYTLDEIMNGERVLVVNQLEALREYKRHGLGWNDLREDLGDKPEYLAKDILLALGY